jgi:sulfopyruvate decarboxylase TPP-binding subunit
MGMAGVLAVPHEIATLNLMHQIPLLILTTMRGKLADRRVFQVIQGQVGVPVLDALGIPHWTIERPDQLGYVAEAVEHTRLIKKPVALCFTKEMLK